MDSAAPGKQWQLPLSDLVAGFIEQRVGVSPSDPKARHPSFIMASILEWKKPTNPIDELKGHLKDIAEDKSTAIINCVYTLQGQAMVQAKVDMEKQVEQQANQHLQSLVGQFIGHLSNVSATESSTQANFVQGELTKFFNNQPQLSGCSFDPALITPVKPGQFPKIKKSESRKGTLSLMPRDGFGRWSGTKKLSYIVDNFDCDTGKYENKDRLFLIRVSKLHKCYVSCCSRDVQVFLQKHGGESGNFTLSKWKPCDGCIN